MPTVRKYKWSNLIVLLYLDISEAWEIALFISIKLKSQIETFTTKLSENSILIKPELTDTCIV